MSTIIFANPVRLARRMLLEITLEELIPVALLLCVKLISMSKVMYARPVRLARRELLEMTLVKMIPVALLFCV
jgi:hypothetical protein